MNQGLSFSVGVVKNNADPAQAGRLQIFIPAIDTRDYEVDDLPWANYVTPFGGTTVDLPVGRDLDKVPGGSAYGLWAVPKNSAQVLCCYLENDPDVRYWVGCVYLPELNRTLPQSVNDIKSELDESGLYPQAEIPHYKKNLTEAKLAPGNKHYKTRGGWERSVSHPSNKNVNKPTDDGYFTNALETDKADSQTVSLTSPGRHYISMSDVPDHCRMRFKTTAGNQIILDDTNERIYISTAMGRNWIEIDEGSGKIYMYTASKFSVHSENDLNLYSDQNINIVAKKRINIQSEERGVKIQAVNNVDLLSSGGNIKITASRDLHLKTTSGATASAVSSSTSCKKPPYSGSGLGLTREWPEEAGSGSSSIFINAADKVNARANGGSISITASEALNLKSMGGTVGLQGTEVGIKAPKFSTKVGSFGWKTIDLADQNLWEQQSKQDFNSDVEVASPAAAVTAEGVKPKMIVPLHDSADGWVRDEDEGQCPTPRNQNYIG